MAQAAFAARVAQEKKMITCAACVNCAKHSPQKMSKNILDIQVSTFTRCTAKTPTDIELLDWLTTDRYKNEVLRIRSTADETAQKRLKQKLPVITPSGTFSGRGGASLIKHSGFMQFDIDQQENRHITNFPQLKDEIKNLTHVAFCGLSVRGHGFWGLVPIPPSSPEDHKRRFDALANDFDLHGIILDRACSDITRLRFTSHDTDAYFNPSAVVYQGITPPVRRRRAPGDHRPLSGDLSDHIQQTEAIIREITTRKIDLTEGYAHWLNIAIALGRTFGEGGRSYFHQVSSEYPGYDPQETDKLFTNCLRYSDRPVDENAVTIGTLYYLAREHGINTFI